MQANTAVPLTDIIRLAISTKYSKQTRKLCEMWSFYYCTISLCKKALFVFSELNNHVIQIILLHLREKCMCGNRYCLKNIFVYHRAQQRYKCHSFYSSRKTSQTGSPNLGMTRPTERCITSEV